MPHELYGPFKPGASPFRTKGNSYRGLVASFDSRVPGGFAAVLATLEDPDAVRFFQQPFLAGSTYDILPLIEVSMAAARLCGVTWREFVRAGARLQAERDLKGVYKVFLRLASPRLVIDRFPRFLLQYFTFGQVSGEHVAKTRYEGNAHGIPKPVAPWLAAVGEGFVPVVMAAAGARGTSVLTHRHERGGSEQGMPLYTVRFTIDWDD